MFLILACQDSEKGSDELENHVKDIQSGPVYFLAWIDGSGLTKISQENSRKLTRLLADKNIFGEGSVIPAEFSGSGTRFSVQKHVPVAFLTSFQTTSEINDKNRIDHGMVSQSGVFCDLGGAQQFDQNEQVVFDEVMKNYTSGHLR